MPVFLLRVMQYLRPYRGRCLLILAGISANLLIATGTSLSFKFLIDTAILPQNARRLAVIVIALGVAFVVAAAIGIGRDYLYADVGSRVLRDIRLGLFVQLQRLSAEFYARAPTGDIMARFSSDLASVENGIVLALPGGLISAMSLVVSVGVLFWLEWRLALLSLLAGPLCLVGPRLLGSRTNQAVAKQQRQEGLLASRIKENLDAQQVIRAFSLRKLITGDFLTRVEELRGLGFHANFLNYLMERTPAIGIQFFNLLVISVGSVLAYFQYLSIGALVSFQTIALSFNESVSWIANLLPFLMRAVGGMRRIDEILDEVPAVLDSPDAKELPQLAGAIAFKNVTFGYAKGQANLRGINFAIGKGEQVAFVGPSGSGKSTVLNLLLRFYDPDHGSVCFDGTDLRLARQDSLRSQISVVFQENFLFNATVRENIRLGREGATDEEIETAARQAEIHDTILQMPDGYETIVGERGGLLSGGQRQRLAIARALVRNPAILLLDEATSALDSASETAILATLKRVTANRTVVSVTHRLSNAVHSDRIIVLDHGQVVEQGPHAELLDLGGVYARLWHKQNSLTLDNEGSRARVDQDWLRKLPFFESVEDALLTKLSGCFVTEHFPEKRVVIHQGDQGDKFYIIVRGHVIAFKADQNKPEGSPIVMDDGDYFGEIALLKKIPRTATVQTLTPCTFLTLNTEQFQDLIQHSPELRRNMEQRILERVETIFH